MSYRMARSTTRYATRPRRLYERATGWEGRPATAYARPWVRKATRELLMLTLALLRAVPSPALRGRACASGRGGVEPWMAQSSDLASPISRSPVPSRIRVSGVRSIVHTSRCGQACSRRGSWIVPLLVPLRLVAHENAPIWTSRRTT